MQDTTSSSCGLDGSSDRRSTPDSRKDNSHNVHNFFQQVKQRSRPSADVALDNGAPENCAAHVDPNSDRRKRRRVTPSNVVSAKAIEETEREGNAQQAQVDASNATEMPNDDRSGNTTLSSGGLVRLAAANNATQPTDQRIDMHTQNEQEPCSRGTTPVEPTPKKGILSLHKNGTLLSPRSHKADDITAVHRPVSSVNRSSRRNMKMRNGKFVQSLELVFNYGHDQASRESFGKRIDDIICANARYASSVSAKTHPFFLGKAKPKIDHNTSNTTGEGFRLDDTDQEKESTSTSKAPVAWSDIKFSGTRNSMYKFSDAIRAIWPPIQLQHIGRVAPSQKLQEKSEKKLIVKAKRKAAAVQMGDLEDILQSLTRTHSHISTNLNILVPHRRLLSSGDLARVVREGIVGSPLPMSNKLYAAIEMGASAFDRGETSGSQNWVTKYAPAELRDVLQPSCHILRDWLKSLAVHNVKSGTLQNERREQEKPPRKKRRQKKSSDDLDDFIVDEDEDEDLSTVKSVKNAVLITGPHGCGKTASVFAVAKEMGFEVFEIHPGMRRSAKDIFDKVGDMTQNHLVQRNDETSRSSSLAPQSHATDVLAAADNSQPSLTGFLGPQKSSKDGKVRNPDVSSKKEQKQSLILFEEVDILFDSDKSFWTGVQNLIHQSKRPVVMTCNDVTQIPSSELDLYTILEYQAPDATVVSDYLAALCASEGHIIDRSAIQHLYTSKGNDLRASINELSFWCQMTVGSEQGGLDWMLSTKRKETRLNSKGERIRICSDGTFHLGLDVLPECGLNHEQMISHCYDSLDLPIMNWIESYANKKSKFASSSTNLQQLDLLVMCSDASSVLDITDEELAPIFASAFMKMTGDDAMFDIRKQVTLNYIDQRQQLERILSVDIVDALDPISVEKPTFPPSHGRLAPSIESCSTAVITDIAPYVRSIVSFDKQFEVQREELFGSQGKKMRNTRAARAAAEGGDKAHTRAERWFPRHLDFERVLATGNDWPQWFPDDQLDS